MLINYFRVAIRQLARHRSANLVNMLGLAFGLACCIICYMHVRFQYSFDAFHANGKQLYRLVTGDPATNDSWVKVAAPIPPKLKADIPDIVSFTRFNSVSWNEKVTVECEGKLFLESSFMLADPNFFSTFSFPLVAGTPSSVLANQKGIVISESIARKLFGSEDPVGKTIQLKDNVLDFEVTGVMTDLPVNTHLRADYIVSFENLEKIFGQGRSLAWGEFNYFGYVVLDKDSDPSSVQRKIQEVTVELPDNDKLSFAEFRLQPVTDIHFQHSRGNLLPSYDKRYIYIFLTLTLFVLLIATMNYFNLATMLSMRRIKEIGVRKSVGADSTQLLTQLLAENLGIVLFALAVAFMIVEVSRPLIASQLGLWSRKDYFDPWFVFAVIAIVALLVLSTSVYLSIYITSFRPGIVLKGAPSTSHNSFAQRSLIFLQFVISLILMISSVVITRQMKYLHSKDLGYNYNSIITVSLSRDLSSGQTDVLKNELRKSAYVSDVATSDFTPGRANWHQTVWWEGQQTPESMFIIAADKDFVKAMQIDMLEGSTNELETSPERQYLLNESARNQIGWEAAKGKMLSPFGESSKLPVAGVVRDFHFTSLHVAVAPLVLVLYKDRKFSQLSVRLAGSDLQSAIGDVESIYGRVSGGLPFDFQFMDDSIGNLYKAEKEMNEVVLFLTFVAVVLALLGIYSLISYSIENRRKEIAIRKVLGISARSLMHIFSGAYLRLAALAAVVAVPLCWWMLNGWLSRFNYRVALEPVSFAAALLALILSIVLVAGSKYAALSGINPAQSLKQE